ncbi:MAG: DUF169 domain-containing protein [Deltaproteobacteria bacterium]|jgi:hypothetical protein|nr:DUF169 domain-containing protein [Deltaproteobacteria bacterium]
MQSKIAQSLKLIHPPLRLIRASAPELEARLFKKRASLKGPWGCAMLLFLDAFINQKTVAFTPDTCRCPGAAEGFGFPQESSFPGGQSAALLLLSQGNQQTSEGRKALAELKAAGASPSVLCEFGDGEGFKKNV